MTGTNMFNHRQSRRRFLQVAGATGFTVVASGLGDYAVAQTPAAIDTFSESPFLAGQDLPPVAERVGEEPLVLQPYEAIGEYGGVWRTALVGGQDTAWLNRTIGYDGLLTWSPDWSEVLPNLARAFEASEDGTRFTYHLRKGTKWSDGAPFTSADVEFYVNNIYRNEALTSSLGSNPFSIEVQDDVTFTIVYEQPNGFALQDMCTSAGGEWTRYPRHYLEQFHIDFNPDGVDALVEEAGVADWVELFRTKGAGIPGTPYNAVWSNAELPRLHAWKMIEPYGDGTRVTFERNPYYWKVDPEGQQLPYIDEVHFDVLGDAEVLLLRCANGEIDMHCRHINTDVNKPVLADNRETGGYEFFDMGNSSMNSVAIGLNLTHKDDTMREIIQNRDFRAGLSHAIDRQEIIDVAFVGQGEPWQLAPRKETPWYNEALAKQYTEYDVDKANELLDKVLPDKNSSGMRLKPDGEPLTIIVEVAGTTSEAPDSVNLVVGYWQAVGVNAVLKVEDRSLLYTRKFANDNDCVIWGGDGGLQDAILQPFWYFPESMDTFCAQAWAVWYRNPAGAQAEPMEPPEDIKQQMELYSEIERTSDPAIQNDLFNQLLAISQDYFCAIGISLPGPMYGIKKVNLKNVPASMPSSWLFVEPGPTRPESYFFQS